MPGVFYISAKKEVRVPKKKNLFPYELFIGKIKAASVNDGKIPFKTDIA